MAVDRIRQLESRVADLEAANRELEGLLVERSVVDHDRARLVRDLGERVKELRALYEVSNQLRQEGPIQDALQRIALCLPSAMQYPMLATARIRHGGHEASTDGFCEGGPSLEASFTTADGTTGSVEVAYAGTPPDAGDSEGPFLIEERRLVDSIAGMVRAHVDRQLAIDAVSLNEALLRIAGRAVRLGGWTLDLVERRVTWSDEICAIHEMPSGSTPSLDEVMEFYAPDDRAEVTSHMEACARLGRPFDLEREIVTARGNRVWVRTIGEAVRDVAGRICGIQGALQDITDRKVAERSLAASESQFRQLAESMPMIVWTALPDGAIDYSNRHFFDYTGVTRTEPPATRWQGCLHPEDLGRCLFAWQESVQQQVPFEVEYRIRRFDGIYRWFRVQAIPSRDQDGTLVKWYGTAIDVHDTKQLEAEARGLAARLTTTLESLTDAFFTLDRDGRFTYVNREAERLLLRDRADLLGRSIWSQFTAAVESPFYREYCRAMDENRTVAFEAFYPPLDRWFDVKAYPSAEGLAVYFRDTTDRRRSEKALAQSHRSFQLLSRCNEALIRSDDEQRLLVDICRLAVEIGGYRMAWVGYASQDDDRRVVPMASAGAELGYLSEALVSWSEFEPGGRGPAGRAIRSGEPVACPDIDDADAGFASRDAARRRGYRGAICLPLRERGRPFGVLTLYTSEVFDISTAELTLLQELSDNLAFGIAGLRTRDTQRRMHEAVLTMARGVSAGTGSEFFEQLTVSMVEALGGDAGFLARTSRVDPGVTMLCAVVDGVLTPDFVWDLDAATRADAASDVWIVRAGARARYPDSATLARLGIDACVGLKLLDASSQPCGLMVVLFRQAPSNYEFITSTLQIFAARAASELDRQKADARLREQASLLDKAQDAILVRDVEDRIVYWNRSAERLYGWTAAEAVGQPVRDLLYRDPAAFLAATAATKSAGEWTGEIEQITRDGQVRIVEGHWTLVRDDQGTPTSVLAINTDITERKQLEQQYLRAQRLESIGTLAGGIAHDLNNVLAPIVMSIDLLRSGEKEPERLETLATIEESARRGADMVRQVLSFARGEDSRQVDVQVRPLIVDLAKIVRETFPRNIRIEEALDPDLRNLSADPTQLHQVLLNLLVNARDAMPDGGLIRIVASNLDIDAHYAAMNIDAREGGYVAIDVEDTGSGMPPDVLDRIFDPFFTTKEPGRGTGLGLSTSLAIVKRHGGFIRAYSVAGRGSRFRVYLRAEAQAAGGSPEAPALDVPRGRGETVLVVDDEGPIRTIARQTLQALGYQVLLASDGVEGLDVYRQHQPDIALVLTDIMMPAMDGLAMVEALRELNPTAKVIGTSGLTTSAHAAGVTGGVAWFLPKPYSALTLARAVASALGRT